MLATYQYKTQYVNAPRVILAASGAGKTHYAYHHGGILNPPVVDGDWVISITTGWPDMAFWWRNQAINDSAQAQHFGAIAAFGAIFDAVIVFNGWTPPPYKSGVIGVVVNVDPRILEARVAYRARHGSKQGGKDVVERQRNVDALNALGYPRAGSFDEAYDLVMRQSEVADSLREVPIARQPLTRDLLASLVGYFRSLDEQGRFAPEDLEYDE